MHRRCAAGDCRRTRVGFHRAAAAARADRGSALGATRPTTRDLGSCARNRDALHRVDLCALLPHLVTAGATNLLLVTFLIPASAILLGWLVLGETLRPRHLGGMAVIGVGLACIDGRLPRLLFLPRRRGSLGGLDPRV